MLPPRLFPSVCLPRPTSGLALALVLTLAGTSAFATEPFAFDPVAELRQALRTPVADPSFHSPDLEQRRQTLNHCVALLCRAPDNTPHSGQAAADGAMAAIDQHCFDLFRVWSVSEESGNRFLPFR